ncbi:hypothetical protein [Pseudomonas fluorescens]|uniref:hypothetical protein n=1 Tax=Pseudomonas fluorescens TaxID=294 RepID=UPI0012429F70|nr:hypothetical protein [Pseudomonas fluorescens]VVP03855.1 hypothetical protein PS898_02953 [Pseudomonas fluorescens]
MSRKKNYKVELLETKNAFESIEDEMIVELPRNPKHSRRIDHRKYLGSGFDAWVIQSIYVIRAIFKGGSVSAVTLIGYSRGLIFFLGFLKGGAVESPPETPSNLTRRHLERYVSWLNLKYPNRSTGKNYYASLKSLLVLLIEYGFVEFSSEELFPHNPFPHNGRRVKKSNSLSMGEMQRLIKALKSDLVSIHKGNFCGNDAEAMTVLFLIIAARSGINTTPLLEMRRDALLPHPFIPSLRLISTIKRRGKGAQIKAIRQSNVWDKYHAISLDGVAVLNKALEMSKNLVEFAPEGIGSCIWLYRSGMQGHSSDIVTLTGGALYVTIKSICERHDLKDDRGDRLVVTVSRLRETMESRLWTLSGGNLLEVASVMGHSPMVADNHYLRINDEIKQEGAIFIGDTFPDKLRGINITPTPLGGCRDTLYGSLAPKDGVAHCSEFIHCLSCPSYAIVGTEADLYRLFSYQKFLYAEIEYFLSDEWAAWRKRQLDYIQLIYDFTERNFDSKVVEQAKIKADESPHLFWAGKIALMKKKRGGGL